MDWRKVDDVWVNFDKLRSIWIDENEDGGYDIITSRMEEDNSYPLFYDSFEGRLEAEEFLNDFMEQNR